MQPLTTQSTTAQTLKASKETIKTAAQNNPAADEAATKDNKTMPTALAFKHPWRPEQKRVVEKLDTYLTDKRIHIVAAPGAGKTVIGLEIFKHLQLKTLAISPTTVVRDQWMERLSDFLPNGEPHPDWCSHSLTQPALFTTATYQGLYGFDKRLSKPKAEPEHPLKNDALPAFDSMQAWFKHHDIKLLILDEAHHLKAAWWQILMKLIRDSDDLIVVSLAATPPYDTNATEWSRYIELCGPVDEAISIPELVRSKSLCPHQDYVWMVNTEERNLALLNCQKEKLDQFIEEITNHQELLTLLQRHYWRDPHSPPTVQTVLYHLEECFALLGLLKKQGHPLPEHLLAIIEKTPDEIQPMDLFDWEVLLQSFIDGKHYPDVTPMPEFRESISQLLRGKHLLKQRRVSLDNSARKLQVFNKTQERIKGCFDITNIEYANRQEWMRLVILADYIHDEKYQLSLDGLEAPSGCYPIFHYFIHHLSEELTAKAALLTGRLSIIHRSVLPKLAKQLAADRYVTSVPYSEHPGYVVLSMPSQYLSAALTALHKSGDLQILIGTHALLGEGWDAPHVNSLILTTQTEADVTTNQLRGRAIRIDPDDDLKTASIWHIIAVTPDKTNNALIFQDLNRRFKTFAGIHANALQIESGIERLVFADDEYANETAFSQSIPFTQHSNQRMAKHLKDDIFNLQARWQNALEKVEKHRCQLGLQMELSRSTQWHHLTDAFANRQYGFLPMLRSPVGIGVSTLTVLAAAQMALAAGFSPFVSAAAGLAGMSASLLTTKVGADLLWRYRFSKAPETRTRNSQIPVSQASRSEIKTMRTFAQIVLNALRDTGQIKTTHDEGNDEVTVSELKVGYFRFSLNGFTRQENDTFLTGLSQLLEPIRQPQYILTLATKPKAHQIIPVPHILGSNKKNALAFAQQWHQHFPADIAKTSVHCTASALGQRYLLKAKVAAQDAEQDNLINLINRWE